MLTRAFRAIARKGTAASAALKEHAERKRTEEERLVALLDAEHAEALRRRMGEDGFALVRPSATPAAHAPDAPADNWDTSQSVAPPR